MQVWQGRIFSGLNLFISIKAMNTDFSTLPSNQPEDMPLEPAEGTAAEAAAEEPVERPKKTHKESPKKGATKPLREGSKAYQALLEKLSGEAPVEQKIGEALEFMEGFLGQRGDHLFKEFWEVRRRCGDLFKLNVNAAVRPTLWDKFSELSREGRRLRELFVEQAAFAVEQIEIAVKALEAELDDAEGTLQKLPEVVIKEVPGAIAPKHELYNEMQRKLSILNAQAARIDVLRGELMKTEMRVRDKNKFFERLSAAGDKVFPIRKELIKEISTQFITDVDHYIESYQSDLSKASIFALREEIKAWQTFAKQITLNSHAFTHSRRHLSRCWDTLKEFEKERRHQRLQERSIYKENADAFASELEELERKAKDNAVIGHALLEACQNVQQRMRKTELDRESVQTLKARLETLRSSALAQEKAEQQERSREEQHRQQQRREKVQQYREQIASLMKSIGEVSDLEALSDQYQQIVHAVDQEHFSRHERQDLEKSFREMRAALALQKDRRLFALTGGSDEGSLDIAVLQTDIEKLQKHRQQIKHQLKGLKATSAASDFAKALEINEQIQQLQERLENTDAALHDLQSKLRRAG